MTNIYQARPYQRLDKQSEQMDQSFDCNAHHPVIAAIDLGTNSCRLLVVRVNIANIRSNYFRLRPRFVSWRVVDSYAKVVRLGEGLHENSFLSDGAIERTVEALGTCRRKLDRYYLKRLRVVATEACRRADNVDLLVQRAREELDFEIEIISSAEEANLALKGCSAVLGAHMPYGIVFDIGGGSTEVVWIKLNPGNKRLPYEIIDSTSLPFGVVTSSEAMAQHQMSEKVRADLFNDVASRLKVFIQKNAIHEQLNAEQVQVLGSSGTVTSLAAMHLNLPQYDRRMVDGLEISYNDVATLVNSILAMTYQERVDHPFIGSGRVEFIVTGSLILKAICEAFPAQFMRIADRGVREGILIDLVKDLARL